MGGPSSLLQKRKKTRWAHSHRPGRPWEFLLRRTGVSGEAGETLGRIPSFIKLSPDLSDLGPSSREIFTHH